MVCAVHFDEAVVQHVGNPSAVQAERVLLLLKQRVTKNRRGELPFSSNFIALVSVPQLVTVAPASSKACSIMIALSSPASTTRIARPFSFRFMMANAGRPLAVPMRVPPQLNSR